MLATQEIVSNMTKRQISLHEQLPVKQKSDKKIHKMQNTFTSTSREKFAKVVYKILMFFFWM